MVINKIIYILLFYCNYSYCFTLSKLDNIDKLYRYWNCIGFENDITNNKPYKFNVGEIPLVAWKNDNNTILSTLNACKHMGSRLDRGIVCNGNLYCPYHGLKHNELDSCGIIKKHDGKIWWSYKPIKKNPPTIPYNNDDYVTSYLNIDMEESLPFCLYNSMDLNHPEYVHNGLGFGTDIAPENYKTHYFENNNKIGISFDYITKPSIKLINYDMKIKERTKNYNELIFPSTSWSCVSSSSDKNKNIIIGVSMLPLKENLTRWYVTIRHNYMTNIIGKNTMIQATKYILNQDKKQFKKQIKNNKLKSFISWKKTIAYENHMQLIRDYFDNYKLPNLDNFLEDLKNDKW